MIGCSHLFHVHEGFCYIIAEQSMSMKFHSHDDVVLLVTDDPTTASGLAYAPNLSISQPYSTGNFFRPSHNTTTNILQSKHFYRNSLFSVFVDCGSDGKGGGKGLEEDMQLAVKTRNWMMESGACNEMSEYNTENPS